MEISYLGHAGVIIKSRDVALACDPWLTGRVFNNGWTLPHPFTDGDRLFDGANGLWISHGHPDHFSRETLRRIPRSQRSGMTVYLQAPILDTVGSWCVDAGFGRVIPASGPDLLIGDRFAIRCRSYTLGDSWLYCRVGRLGVLNTNDCVLARRSQAARIKRDVGRVDVLLTQFSYAAWAGNPEQISLRRRIAENKLDGLRRQVEVFDPAVVIPIAGSPRFCHDENGYLNDDVNLPALVDAVVRAGTSAIPVVMYPGDTYSWGSAWDSRLALARYLEDRNAGNDGAGCALEANVPTPLDAIAEAAAASFRAASGRARDTSDRPRDRLTVFLWDQGAMVELTETGDCRSWSTSDMASSDIAMSSESLAACLAGRYGAASVRMSGRIRVPAGGSVVRYVRFFENAHRRAEAVRVG